MLFTVGSVLSFATIFSFLFFMLIWYYGNVLVIFLIIAVVVYISFLFLDVIRFLTHLVLC